MYYNLYLSFEGGRINALHLYPYEQWMAEHDDEACDSVDEYSNDNSKKVTK